MSGLFAAYPAARSYQPTLRDRAAMALMGSSSPNSVWGQLVQGLVGSAGVGPVHRGPFGTAGLVDMTPVGMAFQADEAGRQMASGHPIAGAANLAMALPIPAGAVASKTGGLIGGAYKQAVAKAEAAAGKAAEKVAEKAAPIIAYHGSPYQFDKFDAAKIGTGEGAQAYGHGLYFAENEKVAKEYRDQLSGYKVDGRDPNDGEAYAIQGLNAAGGDPARAIALHREAERAYPGWSHDEGLKTLQQWEASGVPQITVPGSMYQVGINAHPDHFLDWDKPLSEQPAHVRAVLGDSPNETAGGKLARAYRNPLYAGDIVGKDTATAQELSSHLGANGIPGIKYLDQGSRTAGDGTRNFVVFDPKNIDVLKRYGIGATVLGGAGVAAASGAGSAGGDQGQF